MPNLLLIFSSSATAVIEAALAITYPKSTPVVLARQQIISCVNNALDPVFGQGLGCGGGNSDDAFAFMAKYTFQTVRTMCTKTAHCQHTAHSGTSFG